MNNVFQTYHPAVAFTFIVCAIVLSMIGMHPVFVSCALGGSLLCSAVVRGVKPTLSSLRWIIPMCLIVAIANPLLSYSGSTELFKLGSRAIYLESLLYGLCSGAMLASVFLWFSSYSQCMDSSNSMALLGNVAPIITLMVSQVLRLMSQFVMRGRTIAAVQTANSASSPETKKAKTQDRLRIISVLMSWGMEDGISRSDTMRARGYDCGIKRSIYKRFKFGIDDACALGTILFLAILSVVAEIVALSTYEFYPTMNEITLWWGYAPIILFMFVPLVLQCKEWWQWRSLR